jgi:dienelactone hydrolase
MIGTRNLLVFSALLIIYVSGLGVAFLYNTDFGRVQVEFVSIPGQNQISGILYRPTQAQSSPPYPAVVLAHGISGSKEMMSGIALELAKNGIVSLAIDLVGHGDSEGVFSNGTADPTLGTMDAVRYLEGQAFVNASLIGLVGHSLGAGAIRATAAAYGNIEASVYIAGGLDEMVSDPAYGILNSTFPKNLLLIIGKYDVLFDLEQTKTQLIHVFGNLGEITVDQVYGTFSEDSARKLVTPSTTHLLEPFDQTVVSEVVFWMKESLTSEESIQAVSMTYLDREIALLISLVAFVGFVFPVSNIIFDYFSPGLRTSKKRYGNLGDLKILAIWGTLGLALFVPMFLVGFIVPFPPLIFGSSFSWWLLAVGIAGFGVLRLLTRRSSPKIGFLSEFSQSLRKRETVSGIGIFLFLFLIVWVSKSIFLADLRIIVIPMFNALTLAKRGIVFFTLIPFFLVYFFVEGLYLHELRKRQASGTSSFSQIADMLKTVGIKIIPYLALLAVDYVPMVWLNVRVLPSLVGFLMEFFVGVVPLFAISAVYSWWFHKKTDNIGMGTVLNCLLFAWSAATTFPLVA